MSRELKRGPIQERLLDIGGCTLLGDWLEALERLKKTNNFPEFTGRVCPAICETACVLGMNDDAVTIKGIEYSIIERAYKEGWIKPQMPKACTGKKVAVVGFGVGYSWGATILNF